MTVAQIGFVTLVIVVAIGSGVAVALVGLALLARWVHQSRSRAEERLDQLQGRLLRMAALLSEQARAEGHDARIHLIRAANTAMSEQDKQRRS